MNLIFDIATAHIFTRLRQTILGLLGIATGVGFSIMMAALMEGSQRDFVSQLVDSLPHITVTDEKREASRQPAEEIYKAVQFSGLRTPVTRPGIRNPFATISTVETWLPGNVAPSVETRAVIRYAGRDSSVNVTGIDPHREVKVSKLAEQIRQGNLGDLFKTSNAIIIGDKLAQKLGVRTGNTVVLISSSGRSTHCTVVALLHSGVSQIDESQAYTLLRTAQILTGETGLINAIRIRVDAIMSARSYAARIEGQTGYKSISWQEANEDLLSAFEIRNFIMYTVVGAILLVASFGTYNIISTITHEKIRDIAILKSLGFRQSLILRIFLLEAILIGLAGTLVGWVLGYVLCLGLELIEFKSPYIDSTHLPIFYTFSHYLLAAAVALVASVIAGYLPARKAAAVHPVDIIRGVS